MKTETKAGPEGTGAAGVSILAACTPASLWHALICIHAALICIHAALIRIHTALHTCSTDMHTCSIDWDLTAAASASNRFDTIRFDIDD